MNRRAFVAQASLWLFVTLLGLQIGAGAYETRVVVPLWSGAPPESVWNWNADARYAVRAFERFWVFATPALAASAVAALVAGRRARREHRRWLFVSTALTLALVAATYAYFVPTLDLLLDKRAAGLSAEQVASKVHEWLLLHALRVPFYLAAWLAALRALTVAPAIEDESRE